MLEDALEVLPGFLLVLVRRVEEEVEVENLFEVQLELEPHRRLHHLDVPRVGDFKGGEEPDELGDLHSGVILAEHGHQLELTQLQDLLPRP